MAKVKIQGNASGTGVLTVTAPNTSTDRTITLPDGDVTLGAATPSITDNGNANAITIDSSENVGFGVTPETWDSRKALQIGGNGALAASPSAGSGGYIQLLQNAYTDGTWKYISTDEAARLRSQDGQWNFDVAASGSADSAISWATKVTIDSDGLKFNNDSAAANALDDYEEGTWTPTWLGSQGGTPTYSSQTGGVYTKVGRLVTCTCYIYITAKNTLTGSSNNLKVAGLPFSASSGSSNYAGMTCGYWASTTTISRPGGYIIPGSSQGQTNCVTSAGGNSNQALTAGNLTNSSDVMYSFSYFTDS